MNVREYQAWINSRTLGPSRLIVDGVGGPATRAATLAVFSNVHAPAATDAQKTEIAKRLGGTLRQFNAVIKVEAAGKGFLDSGQPKILYERHYAWKRLRIKIPFLSDPVAGGYTLDADGDGINDSWEKLADMANRNPDIAFESCSWGAGQIMGAHWKRLGYSSVFEMAWSMRESEIGHFEAMARYIEAFGLKPAFQALTTTAAMCVPFAKGYNGPGYLRNSYHVKLAGAMR